MNTQLQCNHFPVIRKDEPYQGYIYTTALDRDGLIMAYSEGLTFQEYNQANDHQFTVTTWEHIAELDHAYMQSRITQPKEIDSEEYYWLLECLPPCKWHNAGGIDIFHMSERITGNLVTWVAIRGGKYYKFDDLDNITDEQIRAKFS